MNSLIVMLDPVTAVLGRIGPTGLTAPKDSKQDKKIVRVLLEILILVNVLVS